MPSNITTTARLLLYLSGVPAAKLLMASGATFCLILYIGFMSPPGVSLAALYLVAVALATLGSGATVGLVVALAAALAEAFLFPSPATSAVGRGWNGLMLWGVLSLAALLVHHLRISLQAEAKASQADFLTGLLNRRAFEERAATELERCRRNGTPLSILHVDCDGFKSINETRGHSEGDRILLAIAAAMRQNLRSTDVLARTGADEFAALLPDSGESQARAVAAKVHGGLQSKLTEGRWDRTCSLGVAVFAAAPENVEAMMQRADELMKSTKQAGKGAAQIDVFFGH